MNLCIHTHTQAVHALKIFGKAWLDASYVHTHNSTTHSIALVRQKIKYKFFIAAHQAPHTPASGETQRVSKQKE